MDHLRRRTSLAVLAALALTTVLVPLTASRSEAAPEDAPGTPVVVSSGGTPPVLSDVLRAPDGTLYASLGSVTSGKLSATVTRRAPGGDWEPPLRLPAPGISSSPVRLALRPDGGVAAIWSEFAGGPASVWYAERAAGHVWSDPVMISADGRDARLAVGSDGEVVAVWTLASVPRVGSATRSADGEWSPAAVISGEPGALEPVVGIGPDGTAVVAYRGLAAVNTVRSVRRPAGEPWSAPFQVAAPRGLGVSNIDLLVDPDGRAIAMWDQYYETPDHLDYTGRLATAWLDAGATAWSPVAELSDPAANIQHFSGDVDAEGVVTVAWTEPVGGEPTVRTARGESGAWSEPVTLATQPGTATQADSVTLDVRDDGRGAAAWLGVSADGEVTVEVATSAADGTWGRSRPAAVNSALGNGRAMLTADGDVDVLYTDSSVRAVFADRTAPVIDVVALPSDATSGSALDFGLAATDHWSETLDVAWDFGDGGTGSGDHAQHTYAYGGTYPVTVTATDPSGNSATSTATLTVAGPPPPGPEPTPGPTSTVPPAPAAPAAAPSAATPRVTALRLTAGRIRAVGSRAKAPRATRLVVQTSDAASATVVIAGKRRGLPTVTLTRPVGADRASVTLRARIGRRTLPPGRYVVTVVADGVGGASAPARATLRVIG